MLRKTVIITGGFGGIGRATAKKFAENGYNIALTYFNTLDNDFLIELQNYGVEVFAMFCNQKNENDIINFTNSVFNEFEYVDVAVLNAGKAESEKMLADKSTEEIDDILDTNLRGTILFAREISRRFVNQKHGNIVTISSIFGQTGGSMESVYSAAKAGIIGLTKSLAVELAPNIRINAIAPGFIDTKMNNEYTKSTVKMIVDETPLERIGTPEDVANAIWFLSSEESSFMTGEVLNIAGGVVRY